MSLETWRHCSNELPCDLEAVSKQDVDFSLARDHKDSAPVDKITMWLPLRTAKMLEASLRQE